MKSFIEHDELMPLVQDLADKIRYIPGFKEQVEELNDKFIKPFVSNADGRMVINNSFTNIQQMLSNG